MESSSKDLTKVQEKSDENVKKSEDKNQGNYLLQSISQFSASKEEEKEIREDKPAKGGYDFEIVDETYKKHVKEDNSDNDSEDDVEKEGKEDKDEDDKKDKKKKKKKKHKKNKKKDEEKTADGKPKITAENENIPSHLRQKYAEYEKNPLCVCVANIPLNSTVTELKGYFLTLISSLRPDIRKYFTKNSKFLASPIRHVEIGSTNNFAVLELDTKELAEFCLTLDNLELQKYRLKVILLSWITSRWKNVEDSSIESMMLRLRDSIHSVISLLMQLKVIRSSMSEIFLST